MVSVMSAVAFGLIYLFAEALPVVYGSFGFSDKQSSLAFIAIGIGLLCGIFTRLYDDHIFRKRQSRRQALRPEDKLTGFAIAAPLLAIGLWWFSWTIPPTISHVHWIVSLLSLVLVGYAANEFDCTLAGYLADSYTVFAASAFAALALLRALCCAMFPLFAHQMFTNLTPNAASSILAAVATVFCSAPSFSSGTEEGFGSQASLQSTAYRPTMKIKWITMTGKMTELGALSLPAIWYRWHKSKSTDLPETVAWSLSLNESFASRNVILEV